jgi:hypothetical protein
MSPDNMTPGVLACGPVSCPTSLASPHESPLSAAVHYGRREHHGKLPQVVPLGGLRPSGKGGHHHLIANPQKGHRLQELPRL